MRISVTDLFTISTRRVTDEGFVVAPGNLARTGVQDYRAAELGLPGDPMRVVKVYRPPEEVFHADSLASFEGKAITIDHPAEDVNAANWRDLSHGEARGVTRAGDMMVGTLTFRTREAIAALDSGKNQLSNGYSCELDQTPGKAPDGTLYDAVQRNIRGNHVAMVDRARCGSACTVSDSAPPTPEPTPMSTQKIIVDGIPLEVSDTAVAVINRLQTELKDTKASLTMATDSMKTMVAADVHAKVVADLDAVRKDVMTPAQRDAMVADWAGMLTEAKRLMPNVVTDGKTCHALRKEVAAHIIASNDTAKHVAAAILGGKQIADADEATAKAVFGAVSATVKTDDAQAFNDSATAQALSGAGGVTQTRDSGADKPKLYGRDAMMARSQAALNA